MQHAWVTPQHLHLRQFASQNASKASGVDAAAEEADQAAAAAADQAAADEEAGSSELSELQELLKKAEEEVMEVPDREFSRTTGSLHATHVVARRRKSCASVVQLCVCCTLH